MARKLSGREFFLLGIVAVVGVASLVYLRGGGGIGGGGQAAERDELSLGDPPVVNLARLEAEPAAYGGNTSDLFHYGKPPGWDRPKPVRPAPKPKPPPKKKPAPAPEPVKREPEKPRPPAIRFEYIGFIGPVHNKIAVFEDGDDILLAAVGEVVQEDFRLVRFGYESVTMGYIDKRFKDKTTQLRQNK